jgi:polysaccharide biosynthesis protein PslE
MGVWNIESVVELLCRRRGVALAIGSLVFGIIALVSILCPPTYVSTAKILVQSNRAQLLVSPGLQGNETQPNASLNSVTEQDLNSEAELLSSNYLIEEALGGVPLRQENGFAAVMNKLVSTVEGLPNEGYDLLHKSRPINPRQQWALSIARHLQINLIKRSNVIEVSFGSHDPIWSQEFLNLFLARYMDFHARMSNDPQAEKFYQEQRVLLTQRLDHSEDVLRGLQLQTGISRVDEQRQALISALYNAQADYRKTTAQLLATQQQVVALEAQRQQAPERISKETKVVQNMALTQIKAQVLAMRAERGELLSRYQPTSNRIAEIDAKIAAAQKVLDHENSTEIQETTSDLNPTWSQLDSQLVQVRAQAASLQAAQTAQNAQIDQIRKQLDSLTSDGMTIERAQLQVDGDKEAYLSYVRKGEEARAARALNQNKILNVNVVEKPTLPPEPAFPNLRLNLAAGLVFAMVLAIGAAYWEEQHDPKVCSTVGIVDAAGVPTIAVLGDRF